MSAMTIRLAGGLLALATAGCGDLALGPVSPLTGTWEGASRNSGTVFTGRIDFDYGGDLAALQVASYQDKIDLVFDGEPHHDSDGNTYTATARTDLDGERFEVKGLVEYTEGKHEGLTYVTVRGSVRYGSMSGQIEVSYPNQDRIVLPFEAGRQ